MCTKESEMKPAMKKPKNKKLQHYDIFLEEILVKEGIWLMLLYTTTLCVWFEKVFTSA